MNRERERKLRTIDFDLLEGNFVQVSYAKKFMLTVGQVMQAKRKRSFIRIDGRRA